MTDHTYEIVKIVRPGDPFVPPDGWRKLECHRFPGAPADDDVEVWMPHAADQARLIPLFEEGLI